MSLFDRALNPPKQEIEKNRSKKKIEPSIGGAVPIKNEKGDITMETVKVKRYVAGKIPEYVGSNKTTEINASEIEFKSNEKTHADHGRRHIFEPKIVQTSHPVEDNDIGHNDKIIDEAISNRRQLLKQQLLQREAEPFPLPGLVETDDEQPSDEEDTSESVEDSEEEEEEKCFLKPVFVPKSNRTNVSLEHNDTFDDGEIHKEFESKRKAETIELIGKLIKEEALEQNNLDDGENIVITDDEDEEKAFEEWKLRELKRMKRDVEEAKALEETRQEIQRLRLMTEEERQEHLAKNPRLITNKAEKGKYKFLQKYYHRGAFYLDTEEDVLKQNFAEPTLEDHFDKSALPSTLQVKDFGKAGRTKYTHLVDQDTSDFVGAWSKKNQIASTFGSRIGGGMKQSFERPGTKRKR